MPKFRLTFQVTSEYEVNPEHYPEGSTIEEMLAIDIEGATDDPFLCMADETFEITGSIIPDNEED